MYHVVYFLECNTGAKVQLLCFHITDITDFVFLHQLQ